jgi:hypothetical protein
MRAALASLFAAASVLLSAGVPVPAFAVEGTQVVRSGSPQLEEKHGYDTKYIFAMTRAVADAPMATGVKPLIMLFTIPADIVLLPVTLIAGFF